MDMKYFDYYYNEIISRCGVTLPVPDVSQRSSLFADYYLPVLDSTELNKCIYASIATFPLFINECSAQNASINMAHFKVIIDPFKILEYDTFKIAKLAQLALTPFHNQVVFNGIGKDHKIAKKYMDGRESQFICGICSPHVYNLLSSSKNIHTWFRDLHTETFTIRFRCDEEPIFHAIYTCGELTNKK